MGARHNCRSVLDGFWSTSRGRVVAPARPGRAWVSGANDATSHQSAPCRRRIQRGRDVPAARSV